MLGEFASLFPKRPGPAQKTSIAALPIGAPPATIRPLMKLTKFLMLGAFALGILAVPAMAETCCEKAKAAGKECSHPCCVKAAKEGKVCEKCNPPKKES
jgi:hypothetical protein